MKKLLPLTFAMLVSTYTSTVCADNSWYLGASYNAQDISLNGRDFNTAGVVAGYKYNQYFAIETRFSSGTSGYSQGNYSEDIDTQASLSIRASYPIFDSFKLYGLAGYTNTKLKIKRRGGGDDSFKITHSDGGLSYGLGLNYEINEQFNLFIDYQVLPDFEPTSTFSKSWKSTTIGVNYSF